MRLLALMWCAILHNACSAVGILGGSADPVGPILSSTMIWSPSSPAGAQAYIAFRKVFTLPPPPGNSSLPATATLHLFADSRYLLWINGQQVARGPCRFNPTSPDYDTMNVTQYLTATGNNSVVIMVHTTGNNSYINGRIIAHDPCVTALLTVTAAGSNASATVFTTDTTTWRSSSASSSNAAQLIEYTPSPVAWSSIPDVVDMRRPAIAVGEGGAGGADWTTTGFDDSSWELPVAVNGSSWGTLLPRAVPMPIEEPILGLSLMPSNTPLASSLPLTLTAGQSIVVNTTRMAMVYPVLLVNASAAGAVLTVEYDLRYVNGAASETFGVGSTFTSAAGVQLFRAADQWACHYMTIACASGSITLLELTVVDRRYNFTRLGSFGSSDPLLDTLWTRAGNTLQAVTDDAYGSDARERNEWLQDPAQPNFITTRVAFAGPGSSNSADDNDTPLFADPRLLRNLLRHAALSQLPDGRIRATFPTDRGPSDCHYFIEDYALQWIEALRLYYDASGDAGFVQQMWPALQLQLQWFLQRIQAPTGLLLAREYTSFDDPLAYITCEGTALNSFLYKGFTDAAYLAGSPAVNDTVTAANYTAYAASIAAALNSDAMWNATEGSYNSAVLNGQVLAPTVHAAMIALERGVVPPSRSAAVRSWFLSYFRNPGNFHVCSNPDYMAMIAARAGVNMTVSHYWVLRVLYGWDCAAGDQLALDVVRYQWANQIDSAGDAGTLWETFFDSESCHNYGAVPAYFLSAYILGVRLGAPVWQVAAAAAAAAASDPALAPLIIEPRLGNLTSAGGNVVTEYGVVTVSWQQQVQQQVQQPQQQQPQQQQPQLSRQPGGSGGGVNGTVLTFTISIPILTLPPTAVTPGTPPQLPAASPAAVLRLADGDASTLLINGSPVSPPPSIDGRYVVTMLLPGNYTGSIQLLAPQC